MDQTSVASSRLMKNGGFYQWFLATRPRTLPAAIAPVALGSALASHVHQFLVLPTLLCASFALLAQIGANFANDYFDFKLGADSPDRLGPVRAVAGGIISARAMYVATLATLGLAAIAGCMLISYGGWILIVIGAASLLAALAYTGGPFPLAYHGLGEVCALVFFGLVAVLGTYFVQAGVPNLAAWIVATACGLLAANILLVNNIRDVTTDARAGKRTLVVRFGRGVGERIYFLNIILVHLTPILLVMTSYQAKLLYTLGAFPMGLALPYKLQSIPAGDGPRFNKLLATTALYLALWAGMMSVAIVLN